MTSLNYSDEAAVRDELYRRETVHPGWADFFYDIESKVCEMQESYMSAQNRIPGPPFNFVFQTSAPTAAGLYDPNATLPASATIQIAHISLPWGLKRDEAYCLLWEQVYDVMKEQRKW